MDTPPQKSWWARNWKWAVPSVVLGVALVFVIVGGAALLLVSSSYRSSWAYSNAVELAGSNAEVAAALGEPVEPGWWVTGAISVSGQSGGADLTIPLRGSRERGTLYVVAEKPAGEWLFTTAEVEVPGRQERIDLLVFRPGDDVQR